MSDLSRVCDTTIRWGILGLIVFTPFAFGTVEPWSQAIMEWGIITLFLVFLLGALWPSPGRAARRLRLTGLEIPIGLFVLFCAAQTIPLPPDLLRVISPGAARASAVPEFPSQEVRGNLPASVARDEGTALFSGLPDWRPISVHPQETRTRVRLLVSLATLFLLAAAWAERMERARFLLTSIAVVGFLVSVQGLVQHLTWNGKVLWIRKVPPSAAFGPFVNHNHFAGYVEMIIPIAISLAFYSMQAGGAPPREERAGVGPLVVNSAERGRRSKAALALFSAVILGVALVLSLSRGGLLSTLVSGLLLFAALWRRMPSRLLAAVALALPVIAVALILWIGAGSVAQQMGTYKTVEHEASFRFRVIIWKSLLRNLPDFLWVGSGLGTFEDSFAPFTPPGSAKRWDRAHNDYLQVLWETGIVGLVLTLSGACIFVRRYWWPALKSRGHPLDVFRVGIAVSILSIAIHSLVDFNLQIGSNGFLFALLAGLLVAVDRVTGRDPRTLETVDPQGPGRMPVAVATP